MENFQTEEQQVEAIKNFWQKHGNSVIAGIVLGLVGFAGVNLYQDNKFDNEVAVSESYMTLQENAQKEPAKFAEQAQQFIAEHSDSSFTSLTAMSLAKTAVEKEDWAEAQQQLTLAVDKAADDGIKAIASLRLARVQIQAQAIDAALITLAKPFPEAFIAAVEEAKGDAYLLQGKKELARNAYQAAVDNDGVAANPDLQMKLDDLAEAINLAK